MWRKLETYIKYIEFKDLCTSMFLTLIKSSNKSGKGIFSIPINFLTQKKFAKCDNKTKTYWYIHLFLMLSYVSLFTMIVVFLEWFQTDIVHPIWHPQRLIGYISTVGLFVGIIYFFPGIYYIPSLFKSLYNIRTAVQGIEGDVSSIQRRNY